jgi:hypothetical protein
MQEVWGRPVGTAYIEESQIHRRAEGGKQVSIASKTVKLSQSSAM